MDNKTFKITLIIAIIIGLIPILAEIIYILLVK